MKKIILSLLGTVIVSGIIGGNMFLNSHTKLDQKKENDKTNIIETKQVSGSEKKTEEEETKKSEQKEKEEKTEQVSKTEPVKETTKTEQPKKNTSNTSSASKTESKTTNTTTKSNSVSTNSNQTQQKSNTTTTTQPSQPSNNTSTQNNNQSNTNNQKNVVSTTFYDSITGGKREFSSESAAFSRGTEIQNKELDYVLNWNEAHPDNQIQPDINYFRVYPSAIDENGKYWYYLHFFCQSGEGNDAKLKSMY